MSKQTLGRSYTLQTSCKEAQRFESTTVRGTPSISPRLVPIPKQSGKFSSNPQLAAQGQLSQDGNSGADIAAWFVIQNCTKDETKFRFPPRTSNYSKTQRSVSILTVGTACKSKLPKKKIRQVQPDYSIRFPLRPSPNHSLPFPFLIVEASITKRSQKYAMKYPFEHKEDVVT